MDLSGEKYRSFINKQANMKIDKVSKLSIRSFTQKSTSIVQVETVDTSSVFVSKNSSQDGRVFEDS